MQARLAYALASVTNPRVFADSSDACYALEWNWESAVGGAGFYTTKNGCCGTAGTPKQTSRRVNVLLDGAPPPWNEPHDGSGPAHVCVCMVTLYDAPWFGRNPWSTEYPDMFTPPDSR